MTGTNLKLARWLRPYWRGALLAPLLMIIEVACDLSRPTLLSRIIDVGVAGDDLGYVLRTGLAMIAIALLGAVGGVGCTITASRASMRVAADLRRDAFRKVQTLVLMLIIIRRGFPLYAKVQQRLDRVNAVPQENLAGVRVVKAFVRGDHERGRFAAANAALWNSTVGAARALVRRPALLILDDSTSAVDMGTEARIPAALRSLPGTTTRLVIAQRISSVMDADRIVVLEDGRVEAAGTHRELLAARGFYAELYEGQLRRPGGPPGR